MHRNIPQARQSRDAFRTVNLASSPTMNKALYAASIYYLLHTMSFLGVIDKLVNGPGWAGKTGNEITVTVNLLGIFVSVFLFWSGMRKTGMARFNKFLPLLAASFLLVSALWSVKPSLTFTQGTTYFFVVVGAIGLVQVLDRDELMDLLSWTCALSAVASLVWQFVLFPGSAFNEIEPDFDGIFSQKNVLGQVMVAGVLGALHCVRIRKRRRLRYICIIALCTTVAFLSKSSTSLVAIVALFYLDYLGRLYLKGVSTGIISVCLSMGCVLLFFAINDDLILEILGKDATLTGRTLIWQYVIDRIGEQPLFGWGYVAFWAPGNPAAGQVAEALNWAVPNAHNGLLEFLLDVGVVGTSLFVLLWARNLVMAVRCMKGRAGQFGLTSVLLLVTILLIGMSEQVLLAALQIWTSLFFIMGFICERELSPARAVRRPGITRSAARGTRATSGSRSPLVNPGGYDPGT
jgi:exopolysaccharide production protein ExoQ